MTKEATIDLTLLRNALSGANLTKLLAEKKLTKYRVAKALGVHWDTVHDWTKNVYRPSPQNAILLGRYLGLVKLEEADLLKLQKKIADLQNEFMRLSKKGGGNNSEQKVGA